MWWSVRAIDGVAGVALSGVLAVGGLLAFTGPPGAPAPLAATYPTGPIPTETYRPAKEPSPSPTEPPREEPQDKRPQQRVEKPRTGEEAPAPESVPAPAPAFPEQTQVEAAPPPVSVPETVLPDTAPAPRNPPSGDLVVSSFNVLGTSHTRQGERGFAPGPVRAQWAAQLIRAYGVDIVGLQELQKDQMGVVTRTLGEYDIWPGNAMGNQGRAWVNSIMWRADEWQAVQSSTTPIPYFKGRIYQMPYLRLRNLQTDAEVWVANFHNPASTRFSGNNAKWRVEARRRQIVLANKLYATGVPVIFTGDMNEREDYFCPVVGQTALEASNGGSVEGTRCDMPANPRIDWVFGTPEIDWLSSFAHRTDLVQRTTDHPMIVATGRLGGATG